MSLFLKVKRYKTSFDFKAYPDRPDGFDNNWANNSLDDLVLFDDGREIFRCKAQTVANYCFGEMAKADTVPWGDTVASGDFTVRCFVPPRKFHGRIHAIINTIDMDGQRIDRKALQTTRGGFQNGRWLIHDKYATKLGRDSTYAWSAGCFILSSQDLEQFNEVLLSNGVFEGEELRGTLMEVDL